MPDIELGCMAQLENEILVTIIDKLELGYFQAVLRNGRMKVIRISDIDKIIDYQVYNKSFY